MEKINKDRFPQITVRANTVDEEMLYVWDKIKRIEFFNRFGYNLSLPKTQGINCLISKSLDNKLEDSDFSILEIEIPKVYSTSSYEKGINTIKNSISAIKETFNLFNKISTKWEFKLFDEYLIRLTQFGPGGSYDSNKGHIIMKTSKDGLISKRKNPIESIIHEIVHIGIEDIIIQKNNIPHETKERIVDKFMVHHFKEIFPDYLLQRIGDVRVERYLEYNDSWDRLPHYIEMFSEKNLQYSISEHHITSHSSLL